MENFVTFEIAKKLKEKGFKEKVNAYYGKHQNIFDVYPALDMNDSGYSVSAPTNSQVLKWLRKKKGIFIGILYAPMSSKGHMDFYYPSVQKIGYYNRAKYINPKEFYSSYEQAALAGIEYVLNNLI